MPPLDSSSPTARTSTRQDSQNVVGNGSPRLVVGALGDHARAAVRAARSHAREGARRPAELALDRLAVTLPSRDSTSGSVAAGRSTGADGEAVRMPPRPRPARSARLHRARRLGAVALLLLLVVLCIGPVRSYLHARTATQQLRTEVAQLDRQHAKLQADLKSASQRTAMIAQARKPRATSSPARSPSP